MTQGGKEMMAERWRGMLDGLEVRDVHDQSYSRDEAYEDRGEGVTLKFPLQFYTSHKPYYTATSSKESS
jgi:hypothetical protein